MRISYWSSDVCSSDLNTAVLKMGLSLEDCVVWNPFKPNGGLTVEQLRDAKMILWKGHCSVHGRFTPEVIDELRAKDPEINILVHPACTYEVVTKADLDRKSKRLTSNH